MIDRLVMLGGALMLVLFLGSRATADDASAQPSATSAMGDACWQKVAGLDNPESRGHAFGRCLIRELAFDPGRYFSDTPVTSSDNLGSQLLDAVFANSYRGPLWAFAIELDCQKEGASGARRLCGMLMRVATWKRPYSEEARPPEKPDIAAIRSFLDASIDWREADLRKCSGGVAKILSLENARWFSFDGGTRKQVAVGEPLDKLSVYEGPMPDINRVTVRAQDGSQVIRVSAQDDAGGAVAWAQAMMKTVEPCLRPAKALAPWDRD
jgi:hypothetical protein